MKKEKWNPGKLIETSGNYWNACTLHAGVQLDIFTIIGKDKLSTKDIAKRVKGSEKGLTMLLNALAAMNLLVKEDDKYSNTKEALSFLSKESRKYVGNIISHHHHLIFAWSQLDKAVMTGRSVKAEVPYDEEKMRESFLLGMFNVAMGAAPEVADKIDLSKCSHLLDLGGGPGTYSIHFCLKNPNLKATIYDLSTTRPIAEKTIDKFGLSDRIAFKDVNYLEQGIEGTFDAAWMSHILHGEGPEDCRKIIEKVVSALKPGGRILIHDFILNNRMDGPLFPALFSLNMLVATESGRTYSESRIMEMLSSAGVKGIERIAFQGRTDSGIISGVV